MRRLGFYGIATPDGELYEDEVCVWGGDEHGKRDAASVCDHLNDEIPEDAPVKYRVVPLFWESEDEPLAESAAWQPIETADRDQETTIILGRPGCSAAGRWQGRYFRADSVDVVDKPDWTHWQPMPELPIPAPPKEEES